MHVIEDICDQKFFSDIDQHRPTKPDASLDYDPSQVCFTKDMSSPLILDEDVDNDYIRPNDITGFTAMMEDLYESHWQIRNKLR